MALVPAFDLEGSERLRDEKFYFDFVKKELSGVNTATFRDVKGQVFSILEGPDRELSPTPVKLLCGEWLFKKIYMLFRLRGEELEKIAKSLVNPIQLDQNILTKSGYLQYRDVEATNHIAVDFYLNSFTPGTADDFFILQLLNDAHLLRNYSGEAMKDKDVKRKLLEIYTGLGENYDKKSNILDVLLRHFPRSKAVKRVSEELSFGTSDPTANRSVFGNAQSVHDREVEKEALRVAAELLEFTDEARKGLEMSEISFRGNKTLSDWTCSTLRSYLTGVVHSDTRQSNTTTIDAFLTRVKIDNTPYSWTGDSEEAKTVNFTIFDLLTALLLFLISEGPDVPNKEDFAPILFSEMDEAKMLCTTGFVARIMSSLQGSTSKFQMKMSEAKRLVGILSHRVCSRVKDQHENVIMGSYDPEYRFDYLNFVCGVGQEIWKDEVSEGKNPSNPSNPSDMVRALEVFSGVKKIWSVEGSKVLFTSS